MAVWEEAHESGLYQVTTMDDLKAAPALYRKRAQIETFFSDPTNRGFEMERSHLSDPERVSRLLGASCRAYMWVVYLGVCAMGREWQRRLYRQDRCDLSLFQLGQRLMARCLKDMPPTPDGLLAPHPSLTCSVR